MPYRPPNNFNICNFFNDLSLILNKNLSMFDNIIFMGDVIMILRLQKILIVKSLIISVTLSVLQT